MIVRFALLGAGRIGKAHARAVSGNPQARLVAVADALPEAAADLAAHYGAEVRAVEAIAAAEDIDAVLAEIDHYLGGAGSPSAPPPR